MNRITFSVIAVAVATALAAVVGYMGTHSMLGGLLAAALVPVMLRFNTLSSGWTGVGIYVNFGLVGVLIVSWIAMLFWHTPLAAVFFLAFGGAWLGIMVVLVLQRVFMRS